MLLQQSTIQLHQNVMLHQTKKVEATLHLENIHGSTTHGSRLVPLRTTSELRTTEEVTEALVVQIPVKLANRVQKLLQPSLPNSPLTRSFTHLRRFATFTHLPPQLKAVYDGLAGSKTALFLVLPPPLPVSPEVSIATILDPYLDGQALNIRRISVPVDPPKSATQSAEWSEKYWPCVFNASAQPLQNAPSVQTLRTVTEELGGDNPGRAEWLMSLAEEVAKQTEATGQGRAIGAVVVNPTSHEIAVVAGDRRWAKDGCIGPDHARCKFEGRPEYHSLMRVITLVAAKERQRRGLGHIDSADSSLYQQLTPLEARFFDAKKPKAQVIADESQSSGSGSESDSQERAGYLCHGLDLYITHEPCVCCSMALIHSRFRVCVFKRRMVRTGGLCAEQENGGLGYGMFWRRELNWRTLTFQLLHNAREKTIYESNDDADENGYHA